MYTLSKFSWGILVEPTYCMIAMGSKQYNELYRNEINLVVANYQQHQWIYFLCLTITTTLVWQNYTSEIANDFDVSRHYLQVEMFATRATGKHPKLI